MTGDEGEVFRIIYLQFIIINILHHKYLGAWTVVSSNSLILLHMVTIEINFDCVIGCLSLDLKQF